MVIVFALTLALSQAPVTGVVRDGSSGVVSGATVVLRTAQGPETRTITGPDGRFSFDAAADGDRLIVHAGGFGAAERVLSGAGELEIVLFPAGVLETVTVTPTLGDRLVGSTAASVSVVDQQEIRASAALVADDVLRQVPTFSLFRRSSSLSSHPTTQGVSLRGIGPSGVSRTLVLVDGMPANDVFGGWVYWTRVPLGAVDRIEIVDGPSSSLYGNYAMGGVINIVTSRPSRPTAELTAQYGSLRSPKVDFFGGDVRRNIAIAIDAGLFDTDGFPVVVENERGPVDTKATVSARNANVKLEYRANGRATFFGRGGYFREKRDNAKISTFTGDPEENDTRWAFVNAGVRLVLPDQSNLQVRGFGDFERFRATFLAVPNLVTRAIGRTSLEQRVPATGVGGLLQWTKAFAAANQVTAGIDWRRVDGDSKETAFDLVNGTVPVTLRDAGGEQESVRAFVQDIVTPTPRTTVTLGARVDHWSNRGGHFLETSVDGVPTAANRPTLPDRGDTVVSPRVAALHRLTEQVSVWGAIGWGFRAPTLNELYRGFRVGAIATLPNDQLGPERLVGGEVGAAIGLGNLGTVRATYFDNRMENPVANVTVGNNLRQRQNLGQTRSRGLQTDVEYRSGSWRLTAGYVLNDATVRAFEENPDLVGNVLPQVPRHRGSIQATYANPRLLTVGVGFLFTGRQFDDDLNEALIPGQAIPGLPRNVTVDLTAARAVGRRVEVFAGAQNLLNDQPFVGTNPTTVGSPRLLHLGIRVQLVGP